MSCTVLRKTLHEVILHPAFFPYASNATEIWDVLEQTDEDPMDPARIVDLIRKASSSKVGAGNSNHNREHTSPKSHGCNNLAGAHAYTDAHMLYLANGSYNSTR